MADARSAASTACMGSNHLDSRGGLKQTRVVAVGVRSANKNVPPKTL